MWSYFPYLQDVVVTDFHKSTKHCRQGDRRKVCLLASSDCWGSKIVSSHRCSAFPCEDPKGYHACNFSASAETFLGLETAHELSALSKTIVYRWSWDRLQSLKSKILDTCSISLNLSPSKHFGCQKPLLVFHYLSTFCSLIHFSKQPVPSLRS